MLSGGSKENIVKKWIKMNKTHYIRHEGKEMVDHTKRNKPMTISNHIWEKRAASSMRSFFFKFRGTHFFMLRLCWALYWNYVKALKEIIVKFVNHGLEDSGHIKVRCERLILTFRNNFKEIIWTGNKGIWFTKRNTNIKIQ